MPLTLNANPKILNPKPNQQQISGSFRGELFGGSRCPGGSCPVASSATLLLCSATTHTPTGRRWLSASSSCRLFHQHTRYIFIHRRRAPRRAGRCGASAVVVVVSRQSANPFTATRLDYSSLYQQTPTAVIPHAVCIARAARFM